MPLALIMKSLYAGLQQNQMIEATVATVWYTEHNRFDFSTDLDIHIKLCKKVY